MKKLGLTSLYLFYISYNITKAEVVTIDIIS